MYDLGKHDGQWDSSHCTNSLVILDFGQVDKVGSDYGTRIYTGPPDYQFVTDTQIVSATESYLQGWWDNTGSCPRLRVGIGTNNGGQCAPNPGTCVVYNAGQMWEATVDAVGYFLTSHNFSWQMVVSAADDMETEWDSYASTQSFVDGFNSWNSSGGGPYLFYDYGDATPPPWGYWSQQQIWQIAWGDTWNVPLPEIYWYCQECQWANVETAAGSMTMQGTMSECTSPVYYNNQFPTSLNTCSSPYNERAPAQSWTLMLGKQAAFGQSSMNYATNIKKQCVWWGPNQDPGC